MPPPSRAWIIWGIGVAAYVVAVLQRTSFGVSGLTAAERFHAGPAALSGFVVLQVIVYAGMQIPAGLLLDRVGSRVMIAAGAVLMAAGQGLLALTDLLPLAVAGRVLVGMGDAFTFISVLRLVPRWFPARRVPLISQLTGMLGQLGQVLSAIPFLAVLNAAGWTTAYLSAAALGVLLAVLALAAIRDAPPGAAPTPATPPRKTRIREVWAHPGTRLGFFTHMGTQFSITTFALMWGVPYLVTAQGLSRATAGVLLTVSVLAALTAGPIFGVLSARHPFRRSRLVLVIMGANITAWTAVLALPGPAPLWLLTLLVVVISLGGPGSMIGFDHARTFNPDRSLGTAQGIVNVGGFLATLLVVEAMGIVLQHAGGYSFDAFRLAWTAQYPIWIVAVTGVLVTRRKTRTRMAAEGIDVPLPRRR
ncbi:nitrate/nitrite transporter [Nocardia sp. NPDC057353]|uniref:MFS transporter n=1 Tax=Nocardia sp. NPDC057353 TaxID=3346104 RepID=UPI00362E35AC